ncbi:MAG: hypothetical protein ABIS03_01855 [Gemmatimonadaceae bacterium]
MDRDEKETGHTNDILHHDNHPDTGDKVGEAVGGVSGALTGAAIGSPGGPIGALIGSIAGAVGGWWAGRTVSEAATKFTDGHDDRYRKAYEGREDRPADRSYDDVRPAYMLGHLASQNPDYNGKNFETIETDLQRGWSNDLRSRHGDWATIKPFAAEAYSSGMSVTSREAENTLDDRGENLSDRASDTSR